MTPNYYRLFLSSSLVTCSRGAHAVIIIYDITDRASYENIPRWFQDMAQFLDPDSIVVLMGNKVTSSPLSCSHTWFLV
jgi:GTPase SAR1 family protein